MTEVLVIEDSESVGEVYCEIINVIAKRNGIDVNITLVKSEDEWEKNKAELMKVDYSVVISDWVLVRGNASPILTELIDFGFDKKRIHIVTGFLSATETLSKWDKYKLVDFCSIYEVSVTKKPINARELVSLVFGEGVSFERKSDSGDKDSTPRH